MYTSRLWLKIKKIIQTSLKNVFLKNVFLKNLYFSSNQSFGMHSVEDESIKIDKGSSILCYQCLNSHYRSQS